MMTLCSIGGATKSGEVTSPVKVSRSAGGFTGA